MFFIIHTAAGLRAMAEAVSQGVPINLTEMAVGDGGGAAAAPEEAQTALVNEVFRAAITRIYTPDPLNQPSRFVAELTIPATAGGFTMREVGIFDANGALFAVGSLPETYKPEAADGAFSDTIVRAEFLTSNAEVVTIQMDPHVVTASQAWVRAQDYATQAWVTNRNYATQPWVTDRGYAAQSYVDTEVTRAAPPGTVAYFARPNAPAGWLKCNGATVGRAAYAGLFAAIGVTFGAGDGSTTFTLPDLRGEFLRGWDDGRGVDLSRLFGSWQDDEFRAHRHTLFGNDRGDNSGTNQLPGAGLYPDDAEFYQITDPNSISLEGGVETRPRNVALLACIKY